MELMREVSASGELGHLAPERVWIEIERAMGSPRPGRFIEVLRECGALAALLPEVEVLFGIPQAEGHHAEIDTGAHLLMAMNLAARLGFPATVVFSLLLHDLGKGLTPRDQWPAHSGHEQRGIPAVEVVCERLKAPRAWRDLAVMVCGLHLRCHRLAEMRPGSVMRLIEDGDLLRRPERLREFLQACEADYRGRAGREDRPYPQASRLERALAAVLSVRARDIETEGLDGVAIGERLRQARIEAIAGSEGPAG